MHNVLCVGASTDIADNDGTTPLQRAQEIFSLDSDPEKKQRYEEVHEHTYTITHFDVANGCWQKIVHFNIILSNINFAEREILLFTLYGGIVETGMQHYSHPLLN